MPALATDKTTATDVVDLAVPPPEPSKTERCATDIVNKIRAGGGLSSTQLAGIGWPQERVDEVLAFTLGKGWLALRGERVVLDADAPQPVTASWTLPR